MIPTWFYLLSLYTAVTVLMATFALAAAAGQWLLPVACFVAAVGNLLLLTRIAFGPPL